MLAVYVALAVLTINFLALVAVGVHFMAAMGRPLVQQVRTARPARPRTRPDGRADLRPVAAAAPAATPAVRGRW